MYALYPEETDLYIRDVEVSRRKAEDNLQDQKYTMVIKEEFIDELLKYDYQSKKKGRGLSSLLISKIGKGQPYKKRKNDEADEQIVPNQQYPQVQRVQNNEDAQSQNNA